jgi:signal transduction histidine kinase
MKLLAKYNRVNIAATIVVLLAGSLCYYFILKYVLLHQLDKDLKVEEQEIADYVRKYNTLPNAANYKDQKIVFEPTGQSVINRNIRSIHYFNAAEKDYVSSRQLTYTISLSGTHYKVSITKSQQETEDLIQLIVLITLAIVVLLLVVLFVINRFVLNKLWLPFNHTLSELKQFNLSTQTNVKLNDSLIDEFKELNNAVITMSNRVLKDYEALKSFTENASHEIQTPLAIVKSKLELLMQSENFTEMQMLDIQTIHDAINRLSKLNQSLLLLTKIDNQQFQEIDEVDIAKIISKNLTHYEELIAAKQITLTKNMEADTRLLMNETMAEVLISNLITNSIKHNVENGKIEITLNQHQLIVSNTGSMLNRSTDELFERFKKDRVNSESLGLGLSIVKKICERYHFKVLYHYTNGLHILTIHFL